MKNNNSIRKINEELAVTGEINLEKLHNIAKDGYQSILNLQLPNEEYWWPDEQKVSELLGLNYANIPINFEELNDQIASLVFETIQKLPKPIIVHCDNCIRASAIVLLYFSNKQGMDFKKSWEQNSQLFLI